MFQKQIRKLKQNLDLFLRTVSVISLLLIVVNLGNCIVLGDAELNPGSYEIINSVHGSINQGNRKQNNNRTPVSM